MQAMDPPGVLVVLVVLLGGSGGGAPLQLLEVQLLEDPAVLVLALHVHEALLAPPPSAAGLAVAASCSHLG